MQLYGEDIEERFEDDIRALDAYSQSQEESRRRLPQPVKEEKKEVLLEEFEIGQDRFSPSVRSKVLEIFQAALREGSCYMSPPLGDFKLWTVSEDGKVSVTVGQKNGEIYSEVSTYNSHGGR